jgi:Ca2+-binding RTX toxin-like protein
VGSTTDDAPLSTSYNSPDDNSCTREDAGRELVFPKLTVNGLQVQRKLYVAPAGLQGGRVLVLVTNPGGAPVTTSVQLGGIDTNDGDLGSDTSTAIRSSSSGDTQFTPADFWAVTSDHLASGGTVNSDLALAHLVDAPGGVDRVDAINVLNPPDKDDVMFRWQSVNILPGQTAAFLFYEVQQGVADANAAAEDAAAAQVATQVEFLAQQGSAQASKSAGTSVTSPVYAGMSSREIGSLRNWPTNLHCFGRTPTIVGDDPTNDTLVGTAGPDVILSFGGNDKINGLGGKDRICAAAGNDVLRGGGGKDMLDGGTGKDRLAGGKGKDSCLGGKGKDKAAGCEKLKKIP